MGEITPRRTRFESRADFARRVGDAYRAAGAADLEIPLLVTHSALATGVGRNVWNDNIGVIKANPAWIDAGRPFVRLFGPERLEGGELVRVRSNWRAYDSLEESAADTLRLMGADRYREARALLAAGDRAWYAALGRGGYYNERPGRNQESFDRLLPEIRRYLGLETLGPFDVAPADAGDVSPDSEESSPSSPADSSSRSSSDDADSLLLEDRMLAVLLDLLEVGLEAMLAALRRQRRS